MLRPHHPEATAELEVLEDNALLASLEQLLRERHVRPERIELRRSGCAASEEQFAASGVEVAAPERDATEDQMALVDRVPVVPVSPVSLRELEQLVSEGGRSLWVALYQPIGSRMEGEEPRVLPGEPRSDGERGTVDAKRGSEQELLRRSDLGHGPDGSTAGERSAGLPGPNAPNGVDPSGCGPDAGLGKKASAT